MSEKIVIRLLTAGRQLLGWTAVSAEKRGDGHLWVDAPVQVGVEVEGRATQVSLHWADLNLEWVRALAPHVVHPGQIVCVHPGGVLITVGRMASGLPPVTVRSAVQIAPPTGGVGARSDP